jgi:sugar phosphate isomerase/epimerase
MRNAHVQYFWCAASLHLENNTMKVSFGSWAFTFGPHAANPVPFDQVARKLSNAGYDGIEISGFPPHITIEEYPSTASRQSLRRMLDDLHLGVSGYSADFTLINPSLKGNKLRYLDLFRRNVDLARDLGSPSIRVDTGTAPGILQGVEITEALNRLAEAWHSASEAAAESRVKVVWEFEPAFEFHKPSEVLELHESVDHSNFSILFDTAHAHMCGFVGARQSGAPEKLPGGVAEFLRLCEGRIGHLHLVDSDETLLGEETSTHKPFGDGRIPFFKLAEPLRSLNLDWWCIDLCFSSDSWDAIGPSLKFVRSLHRAGL